MLCLPLVLGLSLAACEQEKMANQPRYEAYEATDYFGGAGSAQHPAKGTVSTQARLEPIPRPPVSMALLRRGREHFNVFCAPCHGRAGYGNGIIVQHGFPPPPSYHIPRLRSASDRHFFDVISNGYGVMYSYANRVKPRDRWAIVSYIRALQLSQHARVEALPPEVREQFTDGQ